MSIDTATQTPVDGRGAAVSDQPFEVRIAVRGYELDPQGHVNRAVYVQYAEHARWEYLREAGIDHSDLLAAGIGPVTLEETVRYRRELRLGDEVTISSTFGAGDGKTFRMEQEFRLPDASLVAEVTAVGGLLDLGKRRLVSSPVARLRSVASNPDVLDAFERHTGNH
jgi:acyl-CoA thioester hydrolase